MSLPASRKPYFDFFNAFEQPYVNIAWEVETFDFTKQCKAKNISSYHYLVHALSAACLEVEPFLWRVGLDGEPVKMNWITPSFTVMKPDGNFNFCTLPFKRDPLEFERDCLKAKALSRNAPGLTPDEAGRLDYIFITSLPWMKFSFIQHPVFNLKKNHIPSFAFGKFDIQGEVLKFSFAVQAHHGFVDGFHMHQLEVALKKNLREGLS